MLSLSYFPVRLMRVALCFMCLVGLSTARGQAGQSTSAPSAEGSIASAADEWPSLVIGFIGQSRYQPQTVAALAGAIDAARELGPEHRLHVSVEHRSPEAATAQAQNEALRQLFVGSTAGVLIHPVDGSASASLLALLNRQRMPVVTFATPEEIDGISAAVVDDQAAIGTALATEVSRLLDARVGRRSGAVAILAGPQGVQPYVERTDAALEQLARSTDYASYGTFNCEPTLNAALQTLQTVTAAERNDGLNAWISVGGWPLTGIHAGLPQNSALAGYVVAEGLPQMLPYLENGRVFALVSPDYYGVGYEAMRQVLLAQSARRAEGDPAQAEPVVTQEGSAGSAKGEKTTTTVAVPQADAVVRVKVLPRIIRKANLKQYAGQWASWLAQPM